ncbi:MAG: class I mannose-6-phosphate isomerase [Clostridiales bacterium]|nr:class I mannose-6-phosphate isomerase [Clostridiales bacterium]
MSFMFNPFPYDDPSAVNRIDASGIDTSSASVGNDAVAASLAGIIRKGGVIALDGYTTAPFETVLSLAGDVQKIAVSSILKSPAELRELFRDNLPEDRKKDPVLLYGKLFKEGYAGIFDPVKLAGLKSALEAAKKEGRTVLLWGYGAMSEELLPYADVKIFCDITPKRAVLNIKKGNFYNLGSDELMPFKATMRRCYYVDFELAFTLRSKLLAAHGIDFYICGDDAEKLTLLPSALLFSLIDRTLESPFRQRPVYLEGVWGGYYTMHIRNLPDTMKNCAWVFDMIPMEVSTVIEADGLTVEVPFYTVVSSFGEKLMGKECLDEFHGFFPIRFNYDDTYHASGNMSVQLHPGADFVMNENGELGRQDESYYVFVTGQGARTYLGFRSGVDVDEFVDEVLKSEKEHTEIDYQKYIYGVHSEPGVQVMIPAGTIHASGQNQVILEIGSLTVGSYTYKMYDYLRRDLDGNPRPIHSYYGAKNLNHNMTEEYVKANLVNGRKRVLREDENGKELVVGECDQLYFSLRNLVFGDYFTDDTKRYSESGDFFVYALVDGEDVTVRSKAHPERQFRMKYMDMVVIPASLGEVELINNKPGTWTVMHKTMLKRGV